MLSAHHESTKYTALKISQVLLDDEVLDAVVEIESPAAVAAMTEQPDAVSREEPPPESILDVRSRLAFRKLRGETLGPTDEALLQLLNARVDAMLNGQESEADQRLRSLVEEGKRILKELRGRG
jgi:hypothetical protein